MTRPLAFALALLITSVAFADDNWPSFRGPGLQGHSDSTGIPLTWSDTEHVTWKTPIHGKGWSTPVIWNNQIWLTTATVDGAKSSVLCLNRATGEVLLDRVEFANETVEPLSNPLNCYASPSPAIEEGFVYVHFGSYGTACIDTKTFKTLWTRRDLPCRHYRGPGSSVVIYKNLLLLTMDGVDVQYLVALNKKTGETVWKTDRTTDYDDIDPKTKMPKMDGDLRKAYTTAVVVEHEGRPLLLSPGARAAYAYDARDGKELWKITYPGFSNAASVVFAPAKGGAGGLPALAYINTGHGKSEFMAVKVDGKGDVTKSNILWNHGRNVPRRSSPVLVNDLLFMVDDGGIAICLDAKTGDVCWVQRLGDGKEQYSASPIYVDGKVMFCGQEGLTTIVAPTREYKLLATNKLSSGMMASPAVAGKALFLRTKTHLVRIEGPTAN
ncbi:MAG: PQQ-binding-like beta-propeller repeat protein [Phycisphaeraceae bacterium]